MSADASPSSSYDPPAIAADLHAAIAEGLALFAGIDDERSRTRPKPDGWCAREVVGHLIDSACNNHRRFVTGQGGIARFDGYDGDDWVSRQRYVDESWEEIVALWAAYNRHLRHVMLQTSIESAAMSAISPDGSDPVSVGFLMHDYVRHIRHHFEQVKRLDRLLEK